MSIDTWSDIGAGYPAPGDFEPNVFEILHDLETRGLTPEQALAELDSMLDEGVLSNPDYSDAIRVYI